MCIRDRVVAVLSFPSDCDLDQYHLHGVLSVVNKLQCAADMLDYSALFSEASKLLANKKCGFCICKIFVAVLCTCKVFKRTGMNLRVILASTKTKWCN